MVIYQKIFAPIISFKFAKGRSHHTSVCEKKTETRDNTPLENDKEKITMLANA